MIYLRRVSGNSMLPALKNGQIVLAVKFLRPKPGDIVIVSHHGLEKVKRLAKVKTKEIYILGDNAGSSTDSRTLGWLPRTGLMAKVIWPRR